MTNDLDQYQLTRAYRALGEFVVEDLSNWYVRRSRPRFWGNVDTVDTRAAFRTLWEALREVALLAAPCVPFVSDWLHRALTDETVHLQRYPRTTGISDPQLESDMDAARALVSLGRAAREEVKIRVRQPLRGVQAVIPGGQTLTEEVLNVVKEELNVKEVSFLTTAEGIVTLVARPNFRSLGQRFGKQTNDAAAAIRRLSQKSLSVFRDGGSMQIELNREMHELEEGDIDVLQEASSGLVVKGEGAYTVALDPELDDELLAEGVARELVNRIQRLRKDSGLDISDRIELAIGGADDIQEAADQHEEFIRGETLALTVTISPHVQESDFPHVQEVDIDGTPALIGLRSASD